MKLQLFVCVCVPLKGYVASKVIFRFYAGNEKNALWENQVANDA